LRTSEPSEYPDAVERLTTFKFAVISAGLSFIGSLLSPAPPTSYTFLTFDKEPRELR